MYITWVVPPPSKSHHQDYYMFSRESPTKPSFATGILGGGTTQQISRYFNVSCLLMDIFRDQHVKWTPGQNLLYVLLFVGMIPEISRGNMAMGNMRQIQDDSSQTPSNI